MSASITRIRKRIAQRATAACRPVDDQGDVPIKIAHGHTAEKAYLTIQPAPTNGIVQFTLEQYADLLKTMQQVYDSFLKASTDANAKKP